MWNVPLDFSPEELPKGCDITTDRSLLSQADAVVFHLPDLEPVMDEEITKPEGQIWVAGNLECEKNYPWTEKEEFRNLFDLWMGYHQEDDIVYPYYEYSFVEQFRCASQVKKQKNKSCMFISSPFNQSQRQEYLNELMKYTPIDSYHSRERLFCRCHSISKSS